MIVASIRIAAAAGGGGDGVSAGLSGPLVGHRGRRILLGALFMRLGGLRIVEIRRLAGDLVTGGRGSMVLPLPGAPLGLGAVLAL